MIVVCVRGEDIGRDREVDDNMMDNGNGRGWTFGRIFGGVVDGF